MTIGFLVTDLGMGGTQAWAEFAATELLGRGHRVCIIAENPPHDRAALLKSAGAEVYACDVPGSIAEYAAILRHHRVDVIQLTVSQRFQELIRLRDGVGAPLAVSYQHVPKLPWRNFARRLLQPSPRRWGMAGLFSLSEARRWVDLHLGCCRASASGIRRVFWPFLQGRTVRLDNAIPMPAPNSPAALLAPPHFLQVSALNERKQPQMTLQAFAQVLPAFPDARLTFVGSGPLRATLEQQRADLGLDRVDFIGEVRDPGPYYAAANVVVLPSRAEGLPYTLLEGAARGVPLIATNLDGNPEICRHGVNGLLIALDNVADLSQAMRDLAASPQRRQSLGNAGRQLVASQFEISGLVTRLLAGYERAMRQYAA